MSTTEPIVVLLGGRGREETVLRLAEGGHEIRLVLAPARSSPVLEAGLKRLADAGIPFERVERSSLPARLRREKGAILLSLGFPYLIPPEALEPFSLPLNVHPTLLPRYRGPTSGWWVLANGERETGITVHGIDAGMDSGPVVCQRRIPLSRFDTPRSMQRKLRAAEPEVVLEALERVGRAEFRPEPQDEDEATEYPRVRRPEDSEIDPRRPLTELFDEIRACDPDRYPAFFRVDGQKVCIRLWRPEKSEEEAREGQL